jgi:hypothetical protein
MSRPARKSLWTTIGVLSITGIVALSLYAQQRPQGAPQGAPQGFRMQFNPRDLVERTVFGSWGVVSLELDVNDENLHKIHAIYREEWTKLKASLEKISPDDQTQRQQAMQGAMEGVRGIREKIRPLLNDEQNKQLDAWSERQMRGPAGGGAPGGDNRGNRQQQRSSR